MSSEWRAQQGGMCPRTLVSRPRVHLIETALGEGRGDHLDERERHAEGYCETPSASVNAETRTG